MYQYVRVCCQSLIDHSTHAHVLALLNKLNWARQSAQYILVCMRMYKNIFTTRYNAVQRGTHQFEGSFKKLQKDLEPDIFCILLQHTTALQVCRLQDRDIYICLDNVHIACYHPSLSAPGGWCRIDGACPEAPPPPVMASPARAWTWISWKPRFALDQAFDATMCWCTTARFRRIPRLECWPKSPRELLVWACCSI
jgi:hypothetical protein